MGFVSIYRPLGAKDRAAVCARVMAATDEWSSRWFQGVTFTTDKGVWRPFATLETTSLLILEVGNVTPLMGVSSVLRNRLCTWALDTTTATLRMSPGTTQEVFLRLADQILDDLAQCVRSAFGWTPASTAGQSPRTGAPEPTLACMDITVLGPDSTPLLVIRPSYASIEAHLQSAPAPTAAVLSRTDALASTQVNVTAWLGNVRLSLPDILDLGVGDVVKLDRNTSDDIPLFVGKSGVATGTLHRIGDQIAIQVV